MRAGKEVRTVSENVRAGKKYAPYLSMSEPVRKYASSSETWLITEATPKRVGEPPKSCRCQNRNVKITPIPKPMNQEMNRTDRYWGQSRVSQFIGNMDYRRNVCSLIQFIGKTCTSFVIIITKKKKKKNENKR